MSTKEIITASAPGTLFLMGEHAVLHGQQAIAGAVDKRITVRLESREDKVVKIHSALGEYQSALPILADDERFCFVLSAIKSYAETLPSGFILTIESEFSHKVGLGSSAAVTVAVCAVLTQWVHDAANSQQVFEAALKVMRDVQNGRGSGADLAACVYGGLVAYRVAPLRIKPLQSVPRIKLFYAGYKIKTPDVIAHVDALSASQPDIHKQLYQLMGKVTEQAIKAVDEADWLILGSLMNTYQGLMDALGISDEVLASMIYQLREKGALGAKISGSGLGDCVIALNEHNDLELFNNDMFFNNKLLENIPVNFSNRGLEIHVF